MMMFYELGQKPTKYDIAEGDQAYNVKDGITYTKDKWDNIIIVATTVKSKTDPIMYSHANGILITLLDVKVTDSAMVYLQIRGNGYSNQLPIHTDIQFYLYQPTTTNMLSAKAVRVGASFTASVMIYNGALCVWLSYIGYATTVSVSGFSNSGGGSHFDNIVLSDVVKPTVGVSRLTEVPITVVS